MALKLQQYSFKVVFLAGVQSPCFCAELHPHWFPPLANSLKTHQVQSLIYEEQIV